MSIHPEIRFIVLMPALLVWLSACSLPATPSAPDQPTPGRNLTTTTNLAGLADAEKMGCVCKPKAGRWSLVALALKGTTGYQTQLGEFSSLGACIGAQKKHGRICQ